MIMNKFYTVIVVKVDIFESCIVDERHFKTLIEAENFKKNIGRDYIGVIAEV